MNRVWDYIGFAASFMGLGYIVLCLEGSLPHPMLPLGLHAVGIASAGYLTLRLMALVRARWRAPPFSMAAAQTPQSPRRELARPLPTVKPRNHFGLRGGRE
jgi:hypothetical protein